MKTDGGNTAEIIADKIGNHDCATLVREYLERSDEPLDLRVKPMDLQYELMDLSIKEMN